MAVLSALALVVSVVAVVVSVLSYLASQRSAKASEQSAAAAESADRRARTPRLSIMLDGFPDLSDKAIYRVRNYGPQDLDEVIVYRPRPPDNIEYHLAVTGSPAGWANDEISLGPLAMTQEARFTLGCGASATLPDFRVRIECRSGSDQWPLNEPLPSPRRPGLSDDEKATRRQTLTYAQEELAADIDTLKGPTWHTVPLRDQRFEEAHHLILDHAPNFKGPMRNARRGIEDFRAWNERRSSAVLDAEMTQHREELIALLVDAHALLEKMKAAIDTPPQASGAMWGT
jgi:hypothetical protein